MNVACVVVLYHPDAGAWENMRSSLSPLDFLTFVDNSPERAVLPAWVSETPEKIRYVWNGGVNGGIASALNAGAEAALARGARWLLTMDQDSRFPPGELESLIARAAAEDFRSIGIVSPWHEIAVMTERKMPERAAEVPYAFTSGNLLNLAAYRATGPFLEKLFIDFVDFEYCLRLREHGYRILEVPVRLVHALGSMEAKKILGWKTYPGNRSPVRYYYMTRNRLFLWRTHPGFAAGDAKSWAKTLLTLVLFERDRFLKLRHMARGVRDFFAGRYGPHPGR